MLTIGLTGGVGCGKSRVAKAFEELGVPVIEADDLTRELTRPGSPALDAIVEAFGEAILNQGRSLDRRALRRRIFADDHARQRLEAILHPRVRAEIIHAMARLSSPYCVVVIPLMIESGMTDLFKRILVVDCLEAQQVNRVMARDGCTDQDVRAIVANQATRQARLAAADDVIDNTGPPLSKLNQRVRELHYRYLALARRA